MSSPVLQSLIATRVDELFDEMPGVRDGMAESIHRARVACRRIRELLPLTNADGNTTKAVGVVRDAFRQLGRVRDLDIMGDLLSEYEEAVPSAVVAVALARQTLRRHGTDARRTLVKGLEELDFGRVAALRGSGLPRRFPLHRAVPPVGEWTRVLRERIDQRSRDAAAAVEHSGGLYFPNRLHKTRIAIKKLRYAVEVAAAVRLWAAHDVIAVLKKAQTKLGTIHDLHVLSTEIGALAGDAAPSTQVDALRSALDADAARLHRRYVEQRDRLRDAVEACARFAARPLVFSRPAITVTAASAFVLPAAALLLLVGRERTEAAEGRDQHGATEEQRRTELTQVL